MCELASVVQRRHVGDLPEFGTVGEWQGSGSGRGRTWEPHGNGMGTAWERHGMCESALRLPDSVTSALECGKLSALRTGRLYPQEYLGTHF
jgi:hypothetical protein